MRRKAHLLFALMLVLLPACGLLLERGREVVAEVGGEPIHLKDFLLRVRSLDFEQRTRANDSDLEVSTKTRRDILNQMVIERLMILEAEDRGIIISEEEIAQKLGSASQPGGADEEHSQESQEGAHKHEKDAHAQWEIEEARNRLLIEKLKEEETSDAAVKKYYLAHFEEEFVLNSPIVSYEIVAVAAENKSIADALRKSAVEQKTTLFDAYEALGKPPQILEAGVTPQMSLFGVVPQVREVIKRMELYDISEPIRVVQENGNDRYMVIRLISSVRRKPLRYVREEIRTRLSLRLVKNLEKKFGVQYYYEKLNYRVGE
jgi:hypothetical protein